MLSELNSCHFYFNSDWSGETYGAAMSESIARLKARNITTALFGDLHLETLRKKKGTEMQRRGDNCCVSIMGDISTGCPC